MALSPSGSEVRDMQARLNIAGLVADHFEGARARRGVESIDGLFKERDGHSSIRVAIDRFSGWGYVCMTWPRRGILTLVRDVIEGCKYLNGYGQVDVAMSNAFYPGNKVRV